MPVEGPSQVELAFPWVSSFYQEGGGLSARLPDPTCAQPTLSAAQQVPGQAALLTQLQLQLFSTLFINSLFFSMALVVGAISSLVVLQVRLCKSSVHLRRSSELDQHD